MRSWAKPKQSPAKNPTMSDVKPVHVEDLPNEAGDIGEVLWQVQHVWQRNVGQYNSHVNAACDPNEVDPSSGCHCESPFSYVKYFCIHRNKMRNFLCRSRTQQLAQFPPHAQ